MKERELTTQTKLASKFAVGFALTFGFAPLLRAAVIGTNPPALPVTLERIAALPKNQQSAWKKYLARSERQLQADQTFFFAEMKAHGLKETVTPPEREARRRLSLKEPAAWYREPEARRIADIVISF